MTWLVPGAEPFFFPGGPVGCLLVHGFTGTPADLRPLGRALAARGHAALGPRLFAHATRPGDMQRARWQDWMADVESGYHLLQGACKEVLLVGLSMGAALALLAAAEFPCVGVVALSAPWDLPPDPRRPLLRVGRPLSLLLPYVSKPHRRQPAVPSEPEPLSYPVYPLRAVVELEALLERMRAALPRVQAPVLLVHGRGDPVVPFSHQARLAEALRAASVERVALESDRHVPTRGPEGETVAERVAAFVERLGERS